MRTRKPTAIHAGLAGACLAAGPAAAQTFEGLGDLPGGSFRSIADVVNRDGSIVFGVSEVQEYTEHPFRWSADGGMEDLGSACDDGCSVPHAVGVSDDGRTAVGRRTSFNMITLNRTWRWTATGGMEILFIPLPSGMSGDASVVVGTERTPWFPIYEAVRWTEAQGLQHLGTLSGDSSSYASDISADGGVLVGWSGDPGPRQPIRWTVADGMEPLGDYPGDGEAIAASADGSVIIGAGALDSGDHSPFRWTRAGGFEHFDFSSPFTPTGVSGDGSIMVGRRGLDTPSGAMVWNRAGGLRDLKEVLESEHGLDLSGWTLTEATAISTDGTTIVGYGANPDGHTEAWRAVIARQCPADLDGDGDTDSADFLAYIDLFAAGDPDADFNGDGEVTSGDFLAYIDAFAQGC